MLEIKSSAFEHGSKIDDRFVAKENERDISPPLSWIGAPKETKSFALVVQDPDAPDPKDPKMIWTHWILYNIPANVSSLEEGIENFPEGTLEGRNDLRQTGYSGPNPPIGKHRYFFKLYALDVILPALDDIPNRKELEDMMEGHILESAELVGVYEKEESSMMRMMRGRR